MGQGGFIITSGGLLIEFINGGGSAKRQQMQERTP